MGEVKLAALTAQALLQKKEHSFCEGFLRFLEQRDEVIFTRGMCLSACYSGSDDFIVAIRVRVRREH